jgi:hypothetical protein
MYIGNHLQQFNLLFYNYNRTIYNSTNQTNQLHEAIPKYIHRHHDFLLPEPTIISTQQITNNQHPLIKNIETLHPRHISQCHNHLATPPLQPSTRSKASSTISVHLLHLILLPLVHHLETARMSLLLSMQRLLIGKLVTDRRRSE